MPALPYLTGADLGRRVTVRALHPDGSAFDSVGPVTAVGAGWLEVTGRRGPVRLGWSQDGIDPDPGLPPIVAGRVVAPDVSAAELQRVAERGWPPAETAWLGEWRLRWHGGLTRRANSVRVAGSPGLPLADALAAVAGWYEARGGVPRLQVPVPRQDEELDRLGWPVNARVLLMAASAAEVAGAGADLDVELAAAPGPEWLSLVEDGAGGDPGLLDALLTSSAPAVFALARVGGAAAGIARATVEAGWCGITSVGTAPQWRRRGVAGALTAAVAGWGAAQGARMAYLQVLDSNEAAIGLYERMGFGVHHRYVYREPT